MNTEHEELIQYKDQLEQWRVERLAALIELDKLKNIDLPTMIFHKRSLAEGRKRRSFIFSN